MTKTVSRDVTPLRRLGAQYAARAFGGTNPSTAARVLNLTANDPRPKAPLESELWALALDTEPTAPGPRLQPATGESG